jgi:hypothetical protein
MADRAAVSNLVVVDLADRLEHPLEAVEPLGEVSNLVVVDLADRPGLRGDVPGVEHDVS